MREPTLAFSQGIARLLARDPALRAVRRRYDLTQAPRLTHIAMRPWRSATFDGCAFEFTVEAQLCARQRAAAPLI
ncbi:MAG: hypothetical protein D6782_08905, partial [Alphaproteobacteria bacterium]